MLCGRTTVIGADHYQQQPHQTPENMILMDFLHKNHQSRLCSSRYNHKAQASSYCGVQMEHSYSRDWRPTDKTMLTRTLLVHKAPQCPSCHIHPVASDNNHDEGIELDDSPSPPLRSNDHERSNIGIDTITELAARIKNTNAEDEDWEAAVNKTGWSGLQNLVFDKTARILTADRLARMAHMGQAQEIVLRRIDIDKAVQRMRQAMAIVHWDPKITQWLHGLLMDCLPPSYLAAYLDIMQTLKAKLPALVDKMVSGRSLGTAHELMQAALKPPWQPTVKSKLRKIPNNPLVVIVPSSVSPRRNVSRISGREQHWISLFSTMGTVIPVTVPETFATGENRSSISTIMENLVTISRAKLQEVRKEYYHRPILLVGFNAGAAIALQVGVLETNIASIICMGFSSNTLKGPRGHLDDQLVELRTPVLFVIGQNAARTSQEEMEALREQMMAPTSLVVIGSADDTLRIGHKKRLIECSTQEMVDNMIVDEVAEFSTNCMLNPPLLSRAGPAHVTSTPIAHRSQPTLIQFNGSGPLSYKKRKLDAAGASIGVHSKKRSVMDGHGNAANSLLTSYEIVPGKITQVISKSGPNIIQMPPVSNNDATNGGGFLSGGTSHNMMLPMPVIQKQKISMIASNQFVPLNPSLENQTINRGNFTIRTYTPNSAGSRMSAATSNKFYTIRSDPCPPLVTMETIEIDSGDEVINLDADNSDVVMEQHSQQEAASEDLSHILDLPIVFADSDGNIQTDDNQSDIIQLTEAPPSIDATYTTTSYQQRTGPTNKVVYLKSSMKTQPNIISKSQKYVMVSSSDEQQPRIMLPTITTQSGGMQTAAGLGGGNKFEIINSTILKHGRSQSSSIMARGMDQASSYSKQIVMNMESAADRSNRLRNVLKAQQQQQQLLGAKRSANIGKGGYGTYKTVNKVTQPPPPLLNKRPTTMTIQGKPRTVQEQPQTESGSTGAVTDNDYSAAANVGT